MITVGGWGRLGNHIIRNIAVSLIAKKHDLNATYSYKDEINKLGIDLYSGKNIYNTTCELNDSNYFSIYNVNNINYNLNPISSFFQTKEITNLLYNYLHSIKSNIIEKNQFKERYDKNNDLFIHVRLGDVKDLNPGIDYYLNTLKNIKFDNMYISTDEKNHSIIKQLQLYSNVTLVEYDEITTFQFASTCKHIILSHGSFSAIIGYLSFFSTIYYPEYDYSKIWYGDMFGHNWIKMSYL